MRRSLLHITYPPVVVLPAGHIQPILAIAIFHWSDVVSLSFFFGSVFGGGDGSE